jgi:hypothetical protein
VREVSIYHDANATGFKRKEKACFPSSLLVWVADSFSAGDLKKHVPCSKSTAPTVVPNLFLPPRLTCGQSTITPFYWLTTNTSSLLLFLSISLFAVLRSIDSPIDAVKSSLPHSFDCCGSCSKTSISHYSWDQARLSFFGKAITPTILFSPTPSCWCLSLVEDLFQDPTKLPYQCRSETASL